MRQEVSKSTQRRKWREVRETCLTHIQHGDSAVRKEVNLTAPSIKKERGLRDFLSYGQLLRFLVGLEELPQQSGQQDQCHD